MVRNLEPLPSPEGGRPMPRVLGLGVYFEGQGDLVSRLITPKTHIVVTQITPNINLLTKSLTPQVGSTV